MVNWEQHMTSTPQLVPKLQLQWGPNQSTTFIYIPRDISKQISQYATQTKKEKFIFEIIKVFLKAPNWLFQKHSDTRTSLLSFTATKRRSLQNQVESSKSLQSTTQESRGKRPKFYLCRKFEIMSTDKKYTRAQAVKWASLMKRIKTTSLRSKFDVRQNK